MNLSPVERDILVDLLYNGDDSPRNIHRRTGRSREAVSRRCGSLVEKGLVVDKGGGVYKLTNAGILAAQNESRSRS